MTLKYQIQKIMREMIESDPRFQKGCYFCGVKKGKGMTFHHFGYRFDDVVYSDYPNNRSGRLAYLTDLKVHILARPQRFALVCGKHHYMAEACIKFGDEMWEKLNTFRKYHQRMADRLSRKTKRCAKCKIQKPLDEFHHIKSTPLGVASRCKACLTKHGNGRKTRTHVLEECKKIMMACGEEV